MVILKMFSYAVMTVLLSARGQRYSDTVRYLHSGKLMNRSITVSYPFSGKLRNCSLFRYWEMPSFR